jgi:predicted nuclease with TOPRIM domain
MTNDFESIDNKLEKIQQLNEEELSIVHRLDGRVEAINGRIRANEVGIATLNAEIASLARMNKFVIGAIMGVVGTVLGFILKYLS